MKKFTYLITLLVLSVVLHGQDQLYNELTDQITFVVAQDGSGDYTTVQEAINAVPSRSEERSIIYIKNGVYKEKNLYVSSSKINVTLLGQNVDSTILTYHPTHGSPGFGSASVKIASKNFSAYNITIENSYGVGNQAEAITTSSDAQQFAHCRFIGFQDTYYSGSSYRNYFKDCLFIGAVDYIFGTTVVVFDSCQIHNTRDYSWITAARTASSNKFGYVFRDCNITGKYGVNHIYFGRPWGDAANVLFMNCYLPEAVTPQGWDNTWGISEENLKFHEYGNFGPGSDTTSRVDYSRQLTDKEAEFCIFDSIFGTYNSSVFKVAWTPTVDTDPVFASVKKYFPAFLDSSVTNATLASIELNGVAISNFDPEVEEFDITLPEGTTDWPVFEATPISSSMITDIIYPDTIPGVVTVVVSSKYEADYKAYKVNVNSNQQLVFEVKKEIPTILISQDITRCIPIKANEIADDGIGIYPNPSNGVFVVNVQNYSSQEPVTLNIYTQNGQVLYSEKITANEIQKHKLIDLSNFPSGQYLMSICSDEKEYSANLILK